MTTVMISVLIALLSLRLSLSYYIISIITIAIIITKNIILPSYIFSYSNPCRTYLSNVLLLIVSISLIYLLTYCIEYILVVFCYLGVNPSPIPLFVRVRVPERVYLSSLTIIHVLFLSVIVCRALLCLTLSTSQRTSLNCKQRISIPFHSRAHQSAVSVCESPVSNL